MVVVPLGHVKLPSGESWKSDASVVHPARKRASWKASGIALVQCDRSRHAELIPLEAEPFVAVAADKRGLLACGRRRNRWFSRRSALDVETEVVLHTQLRHDLPLAAAAVDEPELLVGVPVAWKDLQIGAGGAGILGLDIEAAVVVLQREEAGIRHGTHHLPPAGGIARAPVLTQGDAASGRERQAYDRSSTAVLTRDLDDDACTARR